MSDTDIASFDILAPGRWTSPVIFNSPHSGNFLPLSFLAQSRLTEAQLHSSEDRYIDNLFMGCLEHGAPMLRALFSRSYIDLNREPYELDSRMFTERLPSHINVSSPRVASGLGTIPRTVGEGLNIYDGPISLADALQRIDSIYRPYHRTLAALLDQAHDAAGAVLLIDCHSMPSSAVQPRSGVPGCDVVLGDRFGSACDNAIVQLVESHFQDCGLRPVRNRPYAGGYFTESHGRPREKRHALQVELNRALYMDERTGERSRNFDALKTCLDELCQSLSRYFANNLSLAQAAE